VRAFAIGGGLTMDMSRRLGHVVAPLKKPKSAL